MGSGKNGTFDKHPDWQQWAIFAVKKDEMKALIENTDLIKQLHGSFVSNWFRFFKCETWTIFLEPLEGHGKWDNKEPFGKLNTNNNFGGSVAVLTRATIRISKLKSFWQNVDAVTGQLSTADGLVTSFGIGEVPWIKQATFSIWENKEAMKQFAYSMKNHSEVIKKTRKENWYSEDMFVRFKPLKATGTINGINPLAGKL